MIKKLLLAVLLAAPICLSAQTLKFGTVNTQEIINVMPDKATADAELKKVVETYTTQAQALEDRIMKLRQELENASNDSTMTEVIYQSKYQDYQQQVERYQVFQQQAQQDLQKKQQDKYAPIQEKLFKAVDAVGAENGFTFIYDLASNILYKSPAVEDVTPLVKAKLGIK